MNILLPIETINRELDYKLILANLLAKKEVTVYIGQHDFLINVAKYLYGGVYLGKTMFKTHFPTDLKSYKFLKGRGFDVIHLDEEGAFFLGMEQDWDRTLSLRLNPNVLDSKDIICTWGSYQASYYKSKLDSKKADSIKIFSTGNPRFEVYDKNWKSIYLDEIDQIKSKYGNYILVNTNLSIANNNFGLSDIFSTRFGYNYDHSESSRLVVKRWNHTNTILGNIVLLIHELASIFTDMSIIVRSHPGENNFFYETVFKGLDNVFVVHEGSVAPWILGSKVVIHDGCTTAIESYFANKNVILYKSIENKLYDQFVPNLVGTKCSCIEDVIKHIQDLSFTHSKITDERALALLENFNHNNSFGSLVDVINDMIQNKKYTKSKKYNKSIVRFQYFVLVLNLKLRSLLRVFYSEKLNKYKAHQKKFYGFNEDFVKNRLNKIDKITNNKVNVDLINSRLIIFKKGKCD